MNQIYKLNKLINKQNVDECFRKLSDDRNINEYTAAVIIIYLVKDQIGLRKTLKVLKAFNVQL